MAGTNPKSSAPGRRPAWDSARGLAVLFMILVHGMMIWGGAGASGTALGAFVDFLGGPPAAPVFLFLMGAGTAISRKSSPGALGFFGVDILACAGLSLLVIAGLGAINAPVWSLPVLGLALNISGRILADLALPGPGALYALAWGSAEFSFFPMLTWAVYPLAGAAWARTIAAQEPEPRRYGRIFLLASAALAALSLPYILGFRDLFPTEESYYHHGPLEALWLAAFSTAWIAVLGWASLRLPAAVREILTALSRAVTPVYVLHWIAIGWLALAIPPGSLGDCAWLVPTLGLCVAASLFGRLLFLHKPDYHGGHTARVTAENDPGARPRAAACGF